MITSFLAEKDRTGEKHTATNLTVSLESAYWYGLNVSNRPDTEFLVNSGDVSCKFSPH